MAGPFSCQRDFVLEFNCPDPLILSRVYYLGLQRKAKLLVSPLRPTEFSSIVTIIEARDC